MPTLTNPGATPYVLRLLADALEVLAREDDPADHVLLERAERRPVDLDAAREAIEAASWYVNRHAGPTWREDAAGLVSLGLTIDAYDVRGRRCAREDHELVWLRPEDDDAAADEVIDHVREWIAGAYDDVAVRLTADGAEVTVTETP